MARVKATPRVYKKRSVPGSGVLTAAALNTRIHRILNAGQELKRFSADTSATLTAANTGWLYYVNPFAGITQGTGLSNRIGDTITIEKITMTCYYIPTTGPTYNEIGLTARTALVKIPDTSLVSTTLAALALTNYVYSGFVSTGELNNHDNKVLADRRSKMIVPAGTATGPGLTTGAVWTAQHNHLKSFKGLKINFKTGSNQQIQDNLLITLAMNTGGFVTAGGSTGIMYMGYNVFYRDA